MLRKYEAIMYFQDTNHMHCPGFYLLPKRSTTHTSIANIILGGLLMFCTAHLKSKLMVKCWIPPSSIFLALSLFFSHVNDCIPRIQPIYLLYRHHVLLSLYCSRTVIPMCQYCVLWPAWGSSIAYSYCEFISALPSRRRRRKQKERPVKAALVIKC